MIDIQKLREYYKQHRVFMSEHAANRCIQRDIKQKDIKKQPMFTCSQTKEYCY